MTSQLWDSVTKFSKQLDIEAAVLMAVIEVESNGRHFAKGKGKAEPLIRFEGHYFDRRLSGSAQARARLRGISAPTAGTVKNPASQENRWLLLEKAINLDRTAALESTSWGIGQVMGAHWKWLGYNNVEHMVETARSGIDGQLELMVRFIEKAGLVPALKSRNWSAFARGYNGPAYAKFGYHIKLAEQYAKLSAFQKPLAPVPDSPATADVLRRGDRGANVEELQRQLTALGYVVDADGVFGGATEKMLKQFQSAHSLPADGLAGTQTIHAITEKLPELSFWKWLANAAKSAFAKVF